MYTTLICFKLQLEVNMDKSMENLMKFSVYAILCLVFVYVAKIYELVF